MSQYARSTWPRGANVPDPRSQYPRNNGRNHFLNDTYLAQNSSRSSQGLSRTIDTEWRTWEELTIKVCHLPARTDTVSLYKHFSCCGNILSIKISGDEAYIIFSPPPLTEIWHEGARHAPLTITKLPRRDVGLQQSPLDPAESFPKRMSLDAEAIEFGFMHGSDHMMTMNKVAASQGHDITLSLDLQRREVSISFSMDATSEQLPFPNELGTWVGNAEHRYHCRSWRAKYKLKIPLFQLQKINFALFGDNQAAFVVSLDIPPRVFRKASDILSTHQPGAKHWNENDAWFRQTDITRSPLVLETAPLRLQKVEPDIDFGRWSTYRLVFGVEELKKEVFGNICRALKAYNVQLVNESNATFSAVTRPSLWTWIDKNTTSMDLLENDLSDITLSFAVRYQLEVCISLGLLSEYDVTSQFVQRLAQMTEDHARQLLEHVADEKKARTDAMTIFELAVPRTVSSQRLSPRCTLVRTATITPTSMYFSTPTVDVSNRIIRLYQEHADRFLRVRFSDERLEGKIFSSLNGTHDPLFWRIWRCLTNGIQIGDRHFEYLACGNSQFREHGAVFFASTSLLTAESIRQDMGNFQDIEVIAKYTSRMGQCFSTTFAVRGAYMNLVEMDDVERNGYNFTDGVGKISKYMAMTIANELGVPNAGEHLPSLFQFRLGGCKGVLAIDPDCKSMNIHIRKSQYKFPTRQQGLEIIRCSSFTAPQLNRQLISILSCLGVEKHVFLTKVDDQIKDLARAMYDEKAALTQLQRRIDPNQVTLTMAQLILDGFMKSEDPFTISLLQLWRVWSTKLLKEKAGIEVEHGAFLLGCTDETGTLQGHFNGRESRKFETEKDRIDALPQVFLRIPKKDGQGYESVERICIVARNPSLHAGDIRIVRAVDVTALHHLRNVIVFPQTGDRDLPSMCSGGDLDGDDFFLSWDPDLIPPIQNWNQKPLKYNAPPAVRCPGGVKLLDIQHFYVMHMKNDSLGRIATAHLANADASMEGAMDPKCLELAELHSKAVDYAKTGVPAQMPRHLQPKKWPHFMPSKFRSPDQTYKSNTVLGQLFDKVDKLDFKPVHSRPFDTRILEAYDLEQEVLYSAAGIKRDYDNSMRRVMAQHDIKTEFEIWTAFVLQHANLNNDYKFHELIGRTMDGIRDQFKSICITAAGGREFEKIAPFAAAMYTVTAEDVARISAQAMENELIDTPLMSFPWLFHRELGKIANGPRRVLEDMSRVAQAPPKRHKKVLDLLGDEPEAEIETTKGNVHHGDLLELFDDAQSLDEKTEVTPAGADSNAKDWNEGMKDSLKEPNYRELGNLDLSVFEGVNWSSNDHQPFLGNNGVDLKPCLDAKTSIIDTEPIGLYTGSSVLDAMPHMLSEETSLRKATRPTRETLINSPRDDVTVASSILEQSREDENNEEHETDYEIKIDVKEMPKHFGKLRELVRKDGSCTKHSTLSEGLGNLVIVDEEAAGT